MSLYTLGLNHQTAPLDVREQVAFSPDALGHALRDLLGAAEGQGSGDPVDLQPDRGLRPRVRAAARSCAGSRTSTASRRTRCTPYIYTLPREKAVTHAFRVASGLDSMVLGEPQILGQMKQAVRHAESAGTLGLVLNRLFQRTFAVAKDVRTQTDIGSASISMAAASVKLAERIFPSISDQRAAADRRGRDDRADGDALRRAQARSRSRSPTARWSAASSSPSASAPRRSR